MEVPQTSFEPMFPPFSENDIMWLNILGLHYHLQLGITPEFVRFAIERETDTEAEATEKYMRFFPL